MKPGWAFEAKLWQQGYALIAGVDEAGRGCLAGPVTAAVVILPKSDYAYRDSKTLTVKQRENMAAEIKDRAMAWAVAEASSAEIDRLNILRATHLAVTRALAQLELEPQALVTDYLRLAIPQIVLAPAQADMHSFQVAAASILAKTVRDARMQTWGETYPAYGFSQNKGYGSKGHLAALASFGPCPIHRRSFKPVMQGTLFASS